MGGSTADTPASPEFLRASDAERDHAVSELRNEFAAGRLSHETFVYRMQSALDARNRGQLAGLFTDLPSRRAGPKKLLARIRAALRGGDPAAPDRRPGEDPDLPRTQRIAGPSHGPTPQAPAWMHGREGNHGSAAAPPVVAADPAPLVFPPGNGVRFTIGRTRDCDLCLTDLSVSRMHALLVREPVPVHAGDRVEFGSMAFIIQGDSPAEPPAPQGSSG